MKSGLFRDEFANFLIKSRKLITKDVSILRVTLPMLKNSWGEDFVPIDQFPKSFCLMAGLSPDRYKPYTPIEVTPDHLDLLVKGYESGKVSSSLFACKEGDRILLKGPREKLNVKVIDGRERIFAFAAGTGITPIYQVLKYLKDTSNNCEIVLFYANKSRQDILFKEELDELAMPGLVIHHVIENERGYLNESDLQGITARPSDYVLVCGPKGFNELLLGDPSRSGSGRGLLNKFESKQIFKF